MIFNLQSLRKAAGNAAKFISTRSSLPVLSHLLLDNCTVTGCDLEKRGTFAAVLAGKGEPFAICLPARTFCDVLNALDGQAVTIDFDQKRQQVKVKSGSSETTIKGMDANEFPPSRRLATTAAIDAQAFQTLVKQTTFAASTDDARPVLQGVRIGDVWASTDGFRIATVKTETPLMSAIIPASALEKIAPMFSNTVYVGVSDGSAVFSDSDAPEAETTRIEVQLIEGNFPDFNAIIPKKFTTSFQVARAGILNALRQVMVIGKQGNSIVRMAGVIDSDNLITAIDLTATSEEAGESTARIELQDAISTPVKIAMNGTYLLEIIQATEPVEFIRFRMNAHNQPIVIDAGEGANYQAVLMPMHSER